MYIKKSLRVNQIGNGHPCCLEPFQQCPTHAVTLIFMLNLLVRIVLTNLDFKFFKSNLSENHRRNEAGRRACSGSETVPVFPVFENAFKSVPSSAKTTSTRQGSSATATASQSLASNRKKAKKDPDYSYESDPDFETQRYIHKAPKSKLAAASKASLATVPKSKQAGKHAPAQPAEAKPVATSAAGKKKPAKGKANQGVEAHSSVSQTVDSSFFPMFISGSTKTPRASAANAMEAISKMAMLFKDSDTE
jgi:hypothetical protein